MRDLAITAEVPLRENVLQQRRVRIKLLNHALVALSLELLHHVALGLKLHPHILAKARPNRQNR